MPNAPVAAAAPGLPEETPSLDLATKARLDLQGIAYDVLRMATIATDRWEDLMCRWRVAAEAGNRDVDLNGEEVMCNHWASYHVVELAAGLVKAVEALDKCGRR